MILYVSFSNDNDLRRSISVLDPSNAVSCWIIWVQNRDNKN